jgi:Tfp pilus assembly protein PilF
MNLGGVLKGAVLASVLWAGAVGAETLEQLLDQGTQYWTEQKLELAEQQFKAAIAMAPDSPKAHQRLAALYLSQNKNQQAIEEYQTAITLQPDNPALFAAICLAYLHEGAYSASQAMCSQALRLDPESENVQQLQQYIDARLEAENSRLQQNHPPLK